jgi:molybdopterin-guanine dinucleotide biosynthesis protein A
VDLPFLHPAFVARVVAARATPTSRCRSPRGFRQPLAAAYRTGLAGLVTDLIARGRSRPGCSTSTARWSG